MYAQMLLELKKHAWLFYTVCTLLFFGLVGGTSLWSMGDVSNHWVQFQNGARITANGTITSEKKLYISELKHNLTLSRQHQGTSKFQETDA